jgi:hypothetical protein
MMQFFGTHLHVMFKVWTAGEVGPTVVDYLVISHPEMKAKGSSLYR